MTSPNPTLGSQDWIDSTRATLAGIVPEGSRRILPTADSVAFAQVQATLAMAAALQEVTQAMRAGLPRPDGWLGQ